MKNITKTITDIRLNKTSQTPLYRQLSEALTAEIKNLPPNTKLPAIRSMSTALDITNATVINAYKNLETKGIIYSITGSGFYTAAKETEEKEAYFNFASQTTNYFPTQAFQQAAAETLQTYGGTAFNITHPQGYEPLRKALSETTQIITTITETLEAILTQGDTVQIKTPMPKYIIQTLKSKGIRITNNSPKYIITTRPDAELLNSNAIIIEIDTQNDFYKNPPKTLHMQNPNKVMYLKTFSSILTPSLNIGCLTYPPDFQIQNPPLPSGFIQRMFANYLKSGNHEIHIKNMQKHYTKRFDKLLKACKTYLSPYAKISEPQGVLGLWITPDIWQDSFYTEFLQYQVITAQGSMFYPQNEKSFYLNISNIPEDRIAQGIGHIAAVLHPKQ